MCGSTNQARTAAFAAAAAYLAAGAAETIGEKAPESQTRAKINFIVGLGGPEAPAVIEAVAQAEEKALGLAREVQIAQAAVLARLLGGRTTGIVSPETAALVAALNNLKAAEDEVVTAVNAANAERDAVLGESDADPILQ